MYDGIMRQCLLHLVRHGQTNWNAQKKLQGHVDIPLNEIGLAEAGQIAKEFEGRSLGGIYSSPLQRAHLTAQMINQSHQHPIQLHDALKEATYGSLDGIFLHDYYLKCLEKFANFSDLTFQEKLHLKLVEDAESYFEIYQRVRPLLNEIALRHLGQEVIVVTHGGLMRAVIGMLLETVQEIQIQNVGYLTLAGDGSQLTIHSHQRIKIVKDRRIGS